MTSSSTPAAAEPVYTVERVSPDAHRDQVLRIWRDNLPVAGRGAGAAADKEAQKFDWIYHQGDEPPEWLYVLRAGAAPDAPDAPIVGTAGFGLRRLQLGDRILQAAVMADLAVDQAHRSTIPALTLVRAAREQTLGSFPFAYGYPNRMAEGVFRRAGYRLLGRSERHVRVLRHGGFIRRALKVPVLPSLAGRLVDGARLLRHLPEAARALVARDRLVTLTEPDARFDRLWEEVRGRYDVVGVRSAAFLRWRFALCPAGTFHFVALAGTDARLAAYGVLEREEQTGTVHLRDLFGHPDRFDDLLALLLPALYAQGATALSFQFLPTDTLLALMARHGFWPRTEEGRSIYVAASAAEGALSTFGPERCHFTDADEDT